MVSDSRTRAQTGYWGWVAGFPSFGGFIPPQFSCAAYVPASSGLNTNVAGFCDQWPIDVQMRAAVAAQVQDPAAATTLWQEVDRALLAQAPVVPVYNRSNVDVVSKRVGNYQYNPQWGLCWPSSGSSSHRCPARSRPPWITEKSARVISRP